MPNLGYTAVFPLTAEDILKLNLENKDQAATAVVFFCNIGWKVFYLIFLIIKLLYFGLKVRKQG